MNSVPLKYAAIDIGSNTLHLLIAELTVAKRLKILHDIQKPTRLSAKLHANKELDPEAIQRSLETLKEFCQLGRGLGVEEIRAVGTSALRRCHNAYQFLKQSQEQCQLKVEIISGFQEAELVLKAVSYDYDLKKGTNLIVDIGGGSTEFIFIKEGKVEEVKSIELGCVDLTEKFLSNDKVTKAQCETLVGAIDERLKLLPTIKAGLKMISLGGTATCLGSLALGLKRYSPDKVEGMNLDIEMVIDTIIRLQQLTIAERIHQLGLQPLRADIILAGTFIQQQIMKKYKINNCIISTKGVRYGLIIKMLEENNINIAKYNHSLN